ncbi:MAG TPA: hypothetical protein VIU62_18825, partial [Chloroflexota bacterium]
VTLTAHDGWQLLHQVSARRQATFGVALGLPTRTVDQIIHWLLAKAAIEYTVPSASTLRSRTPLYTVLPGESLGAAMLAVLDTIEGWLLMTSTGATVIPLGAGEASTYSFGGAGNQPVLQVFHAEELQATNLVVVYTGTSGVLPERVGAQAFDTADARLLGQTLHRHADLQLETANAQAVANALLRKAQLSVPLESCSHMPQVGQQLGDVVTLTDPLTAVTVTGRVQTTTIHFDRDRGAWLQQTTLSVA